MWLDLFHLVLLVQSSHESVPNVAYTVSGDIADVELNLLLPLISTPPTEVQEERIVLNRNITVEEDTVAVLKCTPKFEGDNVSMPKIRSRVDKIPVFQKNPFRLKVKWLREGIENNERISFSSARRAGVATLTIQNVSRNDAGIYTCRKSDTLERFHLNVIGKQIRGILHKLLSFIQ